MIKTIVVPTDGSDHADKAVELAADLAGKYGARVVILHILLRGTPDADLTALCKKLEAPAEITSELEKALQDMLDVASSAMTPYVPLSIPVPDGVLNGIGKLVVDRARAAFTDEGVAKIDVQIVDGSAADVILDAAQHEHADMIVMGSRGLGKFADLLMGSVSHKVSHLAPCTCVAVK